MSNSKHFFIEILHGKSIGMAELCFPLVAPCWLLQWGWVVLRAPLLDPQSLASYVWPSQKQFAYLVSFSSMWLSYFSSSFCTSILIPWWLYVLVVTVALASNLKFHLFLIFNYKEELPLISFFPSFKFLFYVFLPSGLYYLYYYIWCVCVHALAHMLAAVYW